MVFPFIYPCYILHEDFSDRLSEELLQEWDWKEHYSGQPENERYLNYVRPGHKSGRSQQRLDALP
jgi:hypothetical protein